MTVETRGTEFRYPEAVAFLRSLTDEVAAKQPLLIFRHDGVVTRYWCEGSAPGWRGLSAGWVARVITALKPHRDRSEAVAACIRYYEVNRYRMRYGLNRKCDLQVGSGIAECACKHIVGNRFKQPLCRWSKAGANAVLAIRCCLENMRWPDFLESKAWRAAAA